MLRRSLVRGAVKVVSASLVESMMSPDTPRSGTGTRHTTLTFHLRRLRASEDFGLRCRFRSFGDAAEVCFVHAMPTDLVASSAVLRGVLGSGTAAHPSAVRVMSINSVCGLSKAMVLDLLHDGRDVVVQCAVSAVAAQMDGATRTQQDEETKPAKAPAREHPKRRGRSPMRRTETGVREESEEDDAPAVSVRGRGRGSRVSPRRNLRRRRNAGTRAAEAEDGGGAQSPVTDEVVVEDDNAAGVGEEEKAGVDSAADDVNAAALEELRVLSPVKPVRTRRRRRGSKSPAPAAGDATATAKEEETTDDVWFSRSPATPANEAETGDDGEAAAPAQRTRGRRRPTPAADAAATAPERQSQVHDAMDETSKTTAVRRSSTRRLGRPRKKSPTRDTDAAGETAVDVATASLDEFSF
ncbi:hypothetical protein NESM_000258400 [Novymonas esmeraldas]|uniref:Uncharacterized protein n=1 Tax=Novymonas esmeraldas TaxID=1808958 RepID=A0AAW0F791_9TRYP